METSRVWAGPYGKPDAPSAAQNLLRGLEKDSRLGSRTWRIAEPRVTRRGVRSVNSAPDTPGRLTQGSRCHQRFRSKTRSPEAAGRTAESRRDQRPAL